MAANWESTVLSARKAAWKAALAVLKPSRRELERGLALHREVGAVDGFGFLPRLGRNSIKDSQNRYVSLGFSRSEAFQWALAEVNAAPAGDAAAARLARDIFSQAGVTAVVVNVSDVGENARHALINLSAHQQFCRGTEGFAQAESSRDLKRLHRAGDVAVIFSMNGYAPMDAPADLESFFSFLTVWRRLGVRFMHLGYNHRNAFCDGCLEPADGGLSALGRELIRRMETLGILPDLAHAGERATVEAARAAGGPVVITHAGCREIFDHPRCKTDEALKAVAATGGLVGVYTIPSLLGKSAGIECFLAHVKHAVRTVGSWHVTLGTDFSINPEYAAVRLKSGWERLEQRELTTGSLAWSNFPLFTVGLMQVGLREKDIRQILRENHLRVLAAREPKLPQATRT